MLKIKDILDQWSSHENSELELRIGSRKGDTLCLQAESSAKLRQQLQSYAGWSGVDTTQKEYLLQDGTRCEIGTTKPIRKDRIASRFYTVEGTDLVIKISLKTETESSQPTAADTYRCVERTTYRYKNFLHYDVSTVVQMTPSGVDIRDEFEIEVLRGCSRSHENIQESLDAKIRDVLQFWKLDRGTKLVQMA